MSCTSPLGLGRAGRGGRAQRQDPSWQPTRSSASASERRSPGTEWALGIEARSRALLSDGAIAEALYREAIDAARPLPRRAWTWLALACCMANGCAAARGASMRASSSDARARASRRWVPARLRSAPNASCWPQARPRASEPSRPATSSRPHEARIARMARDGASNQDIATELFVSRKTSRVPPAQGLLKARDQHPPAARIRPPWDLSAPHPRELVPARD